MSVDGWPADIIEDGARGLETVTKGRTTLRMLKPEGNEHGNPHTTTRN